MNHQSGGLPCKILQSCTSKCVQSSTRGISTELQGRWRPKNLPWASDCTKMVPGPVATEIFCLKIKQVRRKTSEPCNNALALKQVNSGLLIWRIKARFWSVKACLFKSTHIFWKDKLQKTQTLITHTPITTWVCPRIKVRIDEMDSLAIQNVRICSQSAPAEHSCQISSAPGCTTNSSKEKDQNLITNNWWL